MEEDDVKYYWWHGRDWARESGFLEDLFTRSLSWLPSPVAVLLARIMVAVLSRGLLGTRVEFHPDKDGGMLYVRSEDDAGKAIRADERGHNYTGTCPPKCNGG